MKSMAFVRSSMLMMGLLVVFGAPAQPAVELQTRIEQMQSGGGLTIAGVALTEVDGLAGFYAARGFEPAWARQAQIDALLGAIARLEDYGLDPRDYQPPALAPLRGAGELTGLEPGRRADLDLLLTDSLLRITHDLRYGKVDPTEVDADWNLERAAPGGELTGELEAAIVAIEAMDPERFLGTLFSESNFHRWLRQGLARYRAIAAAGGWPRVPEGLSSKPGMRDRRVPVLVERLRAEDELVPSTAGAGDRYDEAVSAAVAVFQLRHGLEPDGVAGPRTLAALNVPVDARIGQIRVNLERMRWMQQDLPAQVVLVDIAGFRIRLLRDGRLAWSSRVVVGKAYRETPVFRDEIEYLEFNPTWTVPPTILREDIVPKAKRNPDYLRQERIRIIDRNGRRVDPAAVDWAAVSPRRFPYALRQDAGSHNALGRVKFMFPNQHAVYLHDTPTKGLFDRAERTFSSGCIRVERPFELAELLLDDPQTWNQARIQEVVGARRGRTVHLRQPVPIILFYWTAEADHLGRVEFREDIYGRDPPVLAALNRPARSASPRPREAAAAGP